MIVLQEMLQLDSALLETLRPAFSALHSAFMEPEVHQRGLAGAVGLWHKMPIDPEHMALPRSSIRQTFETVLHLELSEQDADAFFSVLDVRGGGFLRLKELQHAVQFWEQQLKQEAAAREREQPPELAQVAHVYARVVAACGPLGESCEEVVALATRLGAELVQMTSSEEPYTLFQHAAQIEGLIEQLERRGLLRMCTELNKAKAVVERHAELRRRAKLVENGISGFIDTCTSLAQHLESQDKQAAAVTLKRVSLIVQKNRATRLPQGLMDKIKFIAAGMREMGSVEHAEQLEEAAKRLQAVVVLQQERGVLEDVLQVEIEEQLRNAGLSEDADIFAKLQRQALDPHCLDLSACIEEGYALNKRLRAAGHDHIVLEVTRMLGGLEAVAGAEQQTLRSSLHRSDVCIMLDGLVVDVRDGWFKESMSVSELTVSVSKAKNKEQKATRSTALAAAQQRAAILLEEAKALASVQAQLEAPGEDTIDLAVLRSLIAKHEKHPQLDELLDRLQQLVGKLDDACSHQELKTKRWADARRGVLPLHVHKKKRAKELLSFTQMFVVMRRWGLEASRRALLGWRVNRSHDTEQKSAHTSWHVMTQTSQKMQELDAKVALERKRVALTTMNRVLEQHNSLYRGYAFTEWHVRWQIATLKNKASSEWMALDDAVDARMAAAQRKRDIEQEKYRGEGKNTCMRRALTLFDS